MTKIKGFGKVWILVGVETMFQESSLRSCTLTCGWVDAMKNDTKTILLFPHPQGLCVTINKNIQNMGVWCRIQGSSMKSYTLTYEE